MADLLVRLYDLPKSHSFAQIEANGVVVRRALSMERGRIVPWVTSNFYAAWEGEAVLALSQMPATMLIAVRGDSLLGFACYDATAKGFFGPTGVDAEMRGQGIGEALLFATLHAMHDAGYAYAVIGDPGPVAFYTKRLDALEIPNSKPGHYAGMLKPENQG